MLHFVQLKGVKLEESFGDQSEYVISPGSSSTAESLQEFPLQFEMDYGLVTKIKPALKERQKDILNIKRGILSSLQIDWSKNRGRTEVNKTKLVHPVSLIAI